MVKELKNEKLKVELSVECDWGEVMAILGKKMMEQKC